jgi:hypothetical protein
MSNIAVNWAYKQKIRASRKFVLVTLCDYANDQHECYPSLETLCDQTCLDRKTVVLCIDELVDMKLLTDTGKRVGKTSSVKVYRIGGSSSENGTTKNGKQFRFSHEAVPFSDSPIYKEPSGEPSVPSKSVFKDRIGGWFKRRPGTVWSQKELKALREVYNAKTPAADVALLESYYTADLNGEHDIRRRDVLTLLNHWPGEIDRARDWKTRPDRNNFGSNGSSLVQKQKFLQDAIQAHPCNKNSRYHMGTETPKQKAEYEGLKQKLSEINTQLAGVTHA